MKKATVLAAMFCLCFQAISVFAATPDFSGYWVLDVGKSVFSETNSIESMTLKVTQTDDALKIESFIKAGQSRISSNVLPVNGRMQVAVYSLNNKETVVEAGNAMARKEARKAELTADGKLNLTLIQTFNAEAGSVTVKKNEIWELLDGGNLLKITRYTETPRGATTAEMYFTKKTEGIQTRIDANTATRSDASSSSKQISGGVLNGKAIRLPAPAYPAAARAVKASGTVNVQVVIDEEGNIKSATAISGHPLLRSAAEEAARNAKFTPTLLEGVPVTVTGVVIYNFVP